MSSDEEIERFWSSVKGKAIARECNKFYSQYEGQSWKNVISIGDSDFERLGTQNAMENYMRETGIDSDGLVDVNGHMYKVRTKTFKMLDEPTVEVGHRFEPTRTLGKLFAKLDAITTHGRANWYINWYIACDSFLLNNLMLHRSSMLQPVLIPVVLSRSTGIDRWGGYAKGLATFDGEVGQQLRCQFESWQFNMQIVSLTLWHRMTSRRQ